MPDFSKQIERIKKKLPEAREADSTFKVFGASSHKYCLNEPSTLAKIEVFESNFSVSLPDCYKTFLLSIGNGGNAYRNSAAGPFFGIYPLGDGVNELIYSNVEEYLNKDCMLSPDMDPETWGKLTAKLEKDDISDEDFYTEISNLYAGILPIGSQGCTYLHGLILTGQNKGKVVNLNMDIQMPKFTYEENFLDWYERWLDEVIDGTLIQSSSSWFGYSIGGSPESLLKKYNLSSSISERQQYLSAILRRTKISSEVIIDLKIAYEANPSDILLLEILTKFNTN